MKQWAGWMLCAMAIGCGGSGPSVYSPDVEAEKSRCISVTHGASEPVPLPPKFAGAADVPPKQLESRRIAGEKLVVPDESTALAIQQSGVHQLVATVKLCMDEGGVPRYANILKSSCFPGYDARIANTMGKWRYSPFVVDGVPSPVCTTVTFIYKLD